MPSIKSVFSKSLVFFSSVLFFVQYPSSALAAADKFTLGSERFKFDDIDALISQSARTLQYLAGGIAIVFLAINGIKIMTSSDSHRAMEEAKAGIWKIMLGCIVVFLAATLVEIFFNATNK